MIVSSVKSSSSNNKATRQELANSCFGRVEKITSTLLTPYTPHPGRRRLTPTSTACVWEDFSEYSLSICDEDDTSKVDDEEDTAATLSSTSRLSNYDKSSSSLTSNAIEPRPGSLLELILKEDTPKLSGCNYTQKMRKRRGSLMQERVIDNVNEFELLKLQYMVVIETRGMKRVCWIVLIGHDRYIPPCGSPSHAYAHMYTLVKTDAH